MAATQLCCACLSSIQARNASACVRVRVSISLDQLTSPFDSSASARSVQSKTISLSLSLSLPSLDCCPAADAQGEYRHHHQRRQIKSSLSFGWRADESGRRRRSPAVVRPIVIRQARRTPNCPLVALKASPSMHRFANSTNIEPLYWQNVYSLPLYCPTFNADDKKKLSLVNFVLPIC